jgi:BirA family transcriptional regulator, biotin operon repressor / biotin---[acetyl-CoA-carboxylase] ligase
MTVDAQILTALRGGGEGGISGAELSQKLGISRAAVWARIEEMRSLGYEIEASPHAGYHLKSVPDVLHGDDIQSRLGNVKVVGRDIRVFKETTSTNDVMEKLARDGAKEGVVVFAETQTKGRGRLGRQWISPKGKGLWFSILLRPKLPPQSVTRVTIASATAVARAIRKQTGLAPQIKWPNDILFGEKKAVGILTELNAELDTIKYVIIGIGVDVNLTAEELPPTLKPIATSLRIEAGQMISRAALAAEILKQLDYDYRRIMTGDFDEVADEWVSQCSTIGRQVSIQLGLETVHGRAEALDSDGALLLRTSHGRLERIMGGDVSVLKR